MSESEQNIFFTKTAETADQGLRLDKFLAVETAALEGFSRSRLQKLIKDGFVTLEDNEMTDCAYKIRTGDVFQIQIPDPAEAEPLPENIKLDIVYEDSDLLVVNKPAGMTVHPAPGAHFGTLVNALLYHCGDELSGIGGVKRPGIVHRIDKETSGLLVVAKNDMAHQNLSAQFFEHSIERTYYACVYSRPSPLQGRIEANIGRSKFDRKKMAQLESGGKSAVTHYKTLQTFGHYAALVQCNLETGRTHQIRVHMAGIGCHLIGDKLYVKSGKTSLGIPTPIKEYVLNFPRQALHAATLGFIHPRSGEKLSFNAPFPDDFQQLLNKLNNV